MTDERGPRRPTIVPLTAEVSEELATQTMVANLEPLQVRIGLAWAQEYADEFCYDHGISQWLRWTGMRWEIDKREYAFNRMIHFTETLRVRDPRSYKAVGSAAFNRGSLEVAAASVLMARHADDFDTQDLLLGTPDGYVDLATGAILPPDPAKRITMLTACSPAPTAECPRFLAFLREAHEGQEEAIDWLQKVAGEALIGRQTGNHFVFFHGTGGNGKSVFTGIMLRILDEYATVAQAGTFTMPAGKAGYRGHLQVLARLRGKRLVVASEPDENEVWDMGRVKEWTGGNKITADMKYQAALTFDPKGLLVMEANHKLPVNTVDNALARRLRLLIWPHTFAGPGHEGKEKQDLKDDLVANEGPGILRWMIEGAMRVQAENLKSCAAVETASKDYLREQDVIRRFIDDCTEEDEHVQPGLNLRDAVAVYNEWALRNEAPARKNIGSLLHEKGLTITKSNTDRYIRQRSLTEEGRTLMGNILMRKIKDRDLTKTEARRWESELRSWKLHGDEKEFLDGMLGVEN